MLPTQAPPNGNAAAPITTAGGQTILGNLTVGTVGTPGSLIVTKVGITDPAAPGGVAYPSSNEVLTFKTPTAADPSNVEWKTVAVSGSAPTVTLTALPTSVVSGGSSVLTWSSTGATSCTASGGWTGTKATSGTQTLSSLTTAASYTLTCTGTSGSGNASETINITAPLAPVVTLTAPASILSQTSGTISWSVTGATSCTASRGPVASSLWSGGKDAVSGTQSFIFATDAEMTDETQQFIFKLACTGGGGTSTEQAIVTVNARCINGSKTYNIGGETATSFAITPTIAACGVINAEAWGGGGGSGAAAYAITSSDLGYTGGGGGGSGAYARADSIPVSGRSGQSIGIVLGAGGTGAPASTGWGKTYDFIAQQYGATGGTSSFGVYVSAAGGSGGRNYNTDYYGDGLDCLYLKKAFWSAPGGKVLAGDVTTSKPGNSGANCAGQAVSAIQGSAGGVGVKSAVSGILTGAGGGFSSKSNVAGQKGSNGAVRIWW